MKRKIKILCTLIVVILLIGISITRNLYNEGMFPIFREDEKMFLEMEKLLQTDTGIICVLIPEKIYYRIGERPQISVLIINRTDTTIYLPNCLDGSSDGTRLPFCDMEILNMNTSKWGRQFIDVMPNPLIENDLQLLRPNESFNPLGYRLNIKKFEPDSILFFEPFTITLLTGNWLPRGLNARNYLIPQNYRIQFVYSTEDTTSFRGWNTHEHFSDFNLDRLDSIPKITIRSNVITLKYRLL